MIACPYAEQSGYFFGPFSINNSLSFLELGLQDLTMVLHALDIGLGVSRLLSSRGIDISVSENVGRHNGLLFRFCCVSDVGVLQKVDSAAR